MSSPTQLGKCDQMRRDLGPIWIRPNDHNTFAHVFEYFRKVFHKILAGFSGFRARFLRIACFGSHIFDVTAASAAAWISGRALRCVHSAVLAGGQFWEFSRFVLIFFYYHITFMYLCVVLLLLRTQFECCCLNCVFNPWKLKFFQIFKNS